MKSYSTVEEIHQELIDNSIVVLVFATRGCSVCKPLKAKLAELVDSIEHVEIGSVFMEDVPEAKGIYGVYTAPIILLFVEGKETKKYSAAMDIAEFKDTLNRYVDLLFA